MPFLRRRGNVASETDMRRRTLFGPSASAPSEQESPMPSPAEHPADTDTDSHADAASLRPSLSSTASRLSRPETPPVQEETNKHRRFSVLRFRNASDSQLSIRAKQQAEKPPPMPRPPEIITTAPTNDFVGPTKKASRVGLAAKLRLSSDVQRNDDGSRRPPARRTLRKSFASDSRPSFASTLEEPLPTGAASLSNSTVLQPPTTRQSESSRSDGSSLSLDQSSQQSPNSTPKKASATSPFFKLRRTKKTPEPLFPMAHLPQKNKVPPAASSSTSLSVASTQRPATAHSADTPRAGAAPRNDNGQRPHPSPAAALFSGGGPQSGRSSPTRTQLLRGRSSTMSSAGRDSTDDHLLPPTTRTSSSTGRKSFGDLFGLSRLRQNSELSRQGSFTPATPGSLGSKSNSLQLAREPVVLPERRDDESPAKYLTRVEEVMSRGIIAAVLSKGSDPFSLSVLRSYMRSFSFFGDPMDMAIRKLLMEAELPKETQHIDRCLQAFANRYHECNPGIYSSPDQAYFVAFSILILHTDVFNKNNKHKMQKADYLKNAGGEGIFDDILECFYDNISYTPFIYVEDDPDLNGDRSDSGKSRRKQLMVAAGDPAKRNPKEPIDPYTLILDNDLESLRPNIKDAMHMDDHFNYLGTAPSLNLRDLQKTFFRTGILQIVSARSRPDAFMSEKTATNPQDAHPGIVDIKVTKVGLLWRKDVKKRKARSPWQEWGAILTGAQLYFFRNTSWVKNLMHQYEHHVKTGNDGIPVIFQPPLADFKPDGLLTTQGSVALHDTTYKKHKNAFVYVKPGGVNEILLADDEDELNDWLAKLNYAAAFRTTGVKMRGVVGGNYDGQGRRAIRRLESPRVDVPDVTQLVQTPTGPVSIARGRIDHQMVEDIQSARREVMQAKIAEADKKLEECQKQLDEHLRNARHLQILAPIQPRTREQLLTAAARMAATLQWTRMEIWKEKCHRDILAQDLEEDLPPLAVNETPTKQLGHERRPSSPTPRPATRSEPRRMSNTGGNKSPPRELNLSHIPSPELAQHADSPLSQVFQTPPQSATRLGHGSRDLSSSRSEVGSVRHGSVSSTPASPALSHQTPQTVRVGSRDEETPLSSNKPDDAEHADEVDAEERHLLEQAGLLEERMGRDPTEKPTLANSAEGYEQGTAAEREKSDKNKIRRSLHRTLREGAGHLSHHRSKRGKEVSASGMSDDIALDNSTLARGTGSFVVHGKKASVINLGTEIQTMSHDEKIRARTLSYLGEQPLSPMSAGDDDDFHSAVGDPVEPVEADEPLADPPADTAAESTERRESIASASTATARSFRELHRKYSTAQAARSASAGGRLTIPSDGESEAAVSFSEGRRSPLPPIENESNDEEEEFQSTRPRLSQKELKSDQDGARDDSDDEEADDDDDDEEEDSRQDRERLHSRPLQAVNA